jgi:hypothetical protein
MSEYYGAISIASNILSIIGYFPEIYSMVYNVEVKITTKIWVIWIASGGLGVTYGVCINNPYVIISNCISTSMCLIVFIVKKWRKIKEAKIPSEIEVGDSEII